MAQEVYGWGKSESQTDAKQPDTDMPVWGWGKPGEPPPQDAPDLPWVDALAQNILLTVQAFQRLHSAWNTKFP